jgi:hypothetical protein
MGPDQSRFELLWGSGHDGGYPAHHLLQQADYGHLQTKALVTWGIVKENHGARFRPSKSMVRRGGREES